LRDTVSRPYPRFAMPLRPRSVAVGYYIAITLLVVGLAIAIALLTGVAGPSREGIRVGVAVPQACETGDGSPSCFAFSISNASVETKSVQCLVVPAEGTTARFTSDSATDQSTVALTLGPNSEQTLSTSVDVENGGSIAPPHVECGPVPA
jgi:hypothetical protein